MPGVHLVDRERAGAKQCELWAGLYETGDVQKHPEHPVGELQVGHALHQALPLFPELWYEDAGLSIAGGDDGASDVECARPVSYARVVHRDGEQHADEHCVARTEHTADGGVIPGVAL